MTPAWRRAAVCAGTIAAATAVHALAGHAVAAGDPIRTALVAFDWRTVALVFFLLGARFFLFFVAPGWALYLGATELASHLARRRD